MGKLGRSQALDRSDVILVYQQVNEHLVSGFCLTLYGNMSPYTLSSKWVLGT